MQEQFVTYEIAKQLKKLGFDEKCFGMYIDSKLYYLLVGNPYTSGIAKIKAPLWQQAISFLGSEGLLVVIINDDKFGYNWKLIGDKNKTIYDCAITYSRYYDAQEQAILEAIKFLQK